MNKVLILNDFIKNILRIVNIRFEILAFEPASEVILSVNSIPQTDSVINSISVKVGNLEITISKEELDCDDQTLRQEYTRQLDIYRVHRYMIENY